MNDTSRFTKTARKTLTDAQAEAARLQQQEVESEHLLLGILCMPNSIACWIVQQLAGDLAALREKIEATQQTKAETVQGEIQLSEASKQIIVLAVKTAQQWQHSIIDAVHLLAGLLQSETTTATILADTGITLEAVKQQLEALAQGNNSKIAQHIQEWSNVFLDKNRQKQANTYRRVVNGIAFIVGSIGIIALIFIFATNPPFLSFQFLNNILLQIPVFFWQPTPGWYPLLIFVYVLCSFCMLFLLALPFDIITSFYLTQRYKIYEGRFSHWFQRYAKSWLVRLVKCLLALEIGSFWLMTQPQLWWLWSWLSYLLYAVLMLYFGTPLLFPLFSKVAPVANEKLQQRFAALMEKTGVKVDNFYVIGAPTIFQDRELHSAVNAYCMHWGTKRAIAITSGVAKYFTLDEIEVILAHELGHRMAHDGWKRLICRAILSLALLYLYAGILHIFLPLLETANTATTGLISFMLLYLCFVLWMGWRYLYCSYCRRHERNADDYALRMTNNPQMFKNAMIRMANINGIPLTYSKSVRRFATHPSLEERLQHADRYLKKSVHTGSVNSSNL